jgi:hypothetical protein
MHPGHADIVRRSLLGDDRSRAELDGFRNEGVAVGMRATQRDEGDARPGFARIVGEAGDFGVEAAGDGGLVEMSG